MPGFGQHCAIIGCANVKAAVIDALVYREAVLTTFEWFGIGQGLHQCKLIGLNHKGIAYSNVCVQCDCVAGDAECASNVVLFIEQKLPIEFDIDGCSGHRKTTNSGIGHGGSIGYLESLYTSIKHIYSAFFRIGTRGADQDLASIGGSANTVTKSGIGCQSRHGNLGYWLPIVSGTHTDLCARGRCCRKCEVRRIGCAKIVVICGSLQNIVHIHRNTVY